MQSTLPFGSRAAPATRRVGAACSGPQRPTARCLAVRFEQPLPPPISSSHRAAPTAALALSTLPLFSGPALADESQAADVAPLGITAAGWALVLSPIVFYALFTLYRTQIDPKAKFGDAVFAFAAFIILANIVSITVFKVRIY